MSFDSPNTIYKIVTLYGQQGKDDVIRAMNEVDGNWKKLALVHETNGKKMRDTFVRQKDDSIKWATHTEADIKKVVSVLSKETQYFIENGKRIKQTLTTMSDGTTNITRQTTTELGKLGKQTQSYGDIIKRALFVAPAWMMVRGIIQGVIGTMKDAAIQSVELEKALTRIQIVGKNSKSEVRELGATIMSLSSLYGTSSKDSIKGATLYAQMGLGKSEIESLMRITMLGSNVLGTDTETTINNITAAIKGFGYQVNDASKIMDAWSNVEKQFAVTAVDLAEATKVVAANAKSMGMSMAEALGDVTAIVEVTRKSGSEVGRGLSFIYTRLKTSAVETIQNVGKVKMYLDEYGNATDVVTNKMRSNSSVFTELSQKWNTFTEIERTAIAESAGSKRQMVLFNALMQNYSTSLSAQITALTSAGAAQQAMNLVMDTADFKIKRAQASWNEYTASLVDTAAFKWVIDAINLLNDSDLMVFNSDRWRQKNIIEERNPIISGEQTKLTELQNLKELIAKRKELASLNDVTNVKKIDDYLTTRPQDVKQLIKSPENIDSAIIQQRANVFKAELGIKYNKEIIRLQESQNYLLSVGQIQAASEVEKQKLKIREKFLQDVADKEKEFQAKKVLNAPLEEVENAEEMVKKDQERLQIEGELIKIKYSSNLNTYQQLQAEKELIKASQYQFDEKQKQAELQKLDNKMLETKLKLQYDINNENKKETLEKQKRQNLAAYGESQFSSRQEKIFDIYKRYGAGTAQTIARIFQGGFNEQEIRASGKFGLFKREFGSDLKNVQMTELMKSNPNLLKDLDASEKNKALELDYRKQELTSIQALETATKDNQKRDKEFQDKLIKNTEKPVIIHFNNKTYELDPRTGIQKEIEKY